MASDFTLKIGGDFREVISGFKKVISGFKHVSSEATQSFRAPQQSIQNLGSQLQNFGSLAKGVVAGLAGVAGFKSLTKDFMDYHTNLANAVQIQGYSVTKLEAMGGAMRRFGGDTSGAISSLNNLNSAITQAKLHGSGSLVEAVQRYGITVKNSNGQLMNAEELLQSLSKQLNRFDASTKQAIASQLGLDDALLRVIDTGNFDSLIAHQMKLNKTTQKDLQVATDFESAWLDMKDTLASVAKQISLLLLPPLTKLMKIITDGIQKFKSFKNGQLTGWLAMGGVVVAFISKLTFLGKAFGTVIGIAKGFTSVVGILGNISTIVSSIFSPVKLIIGAFMLLGLVVEDIYSYFKGEGSIFGDLAKEYPIVQTFLDTLGTAIDKIKSGISQVKDFLSNPSWEKFTKLVSNLTDEIKNIFDGLMNELLALFDKPLEKLKDIGSGITGAVGKGWEWVKGKFTGEKEPELTQAPLSTVSNSNAKNVDNSTTTVTNNITQNIQNGDPKTIQEATIKATNPPDYQKAIAMNTK